MINNIKNILVGIYTLFFSLLLMAQNSSPIGKWKAYVSHNSCKEIAYKGGVYYVITSGGLFTYDEQEQSIQTFSTPEGLSDLNSTTIFHDSLHNLIVIGYEDGTINYFQDPSQEISVITDISRTQLFGNKRINQIISNTQYLYIATGFGIVQYDLIKNETRNTFSKIGANEAGTPVYDIFIYNNTLYATTTNGLFSASLSFPNLADGQAWSPVSIQGLPPQVNSSRFLAGSATKLFANYGDTIYEKVDTGWVKPALTQYGPIRHLSYESGMLAVTMPLRIDAILPTGTEVVWFAEDPQSVFPFRNNPLKFFICEKQKGLTVFNNYSESTIKPFGPYNNYSTQLGGSGKEFYIAPRGIVPPSIPAYDASGIYYYHSENGWRHLTKNNGTLTNEGSMDFSCIEYDEDSNTAWCGSFQQGLAEVKNGYLVFFYDGQNSGIKGRTKVNGVEVDIRVYDLELDRNKNLWMTTVFGTYPLQVRTKAGNWYSYSLATSGDRVRNLIIDNAGYKWIVSSGQGILVYDDRNDLTNVATHRQRILTTTQGQGALPSESINCLIKDREGRIWVGTSLGIGVFYNPTAVFSSANIDAQRPVFNRRPLFTNEPVYSMAVDGQNRKWIGTRNGLFLMSADGTEQLAAYNTENSPLFSNFIQDIHINPDNGEVFISTDLGLISWQGEAIEPLSACDTLQVYPNPIYENYEGMIAIKGSMESTTFRITSATGQLVKELESLGGQGIWDGKDINNQKMSTGVYLVFSANSENQKESACVAKLAIIPKP
ncbi:MAG: hypothetical protein EBS07_05075 [Sphingobacteriia bacterium]|nr:hypothetical protein [Sphingobacteriia bacterium]